MGTGEWTMNYDDHLWGIGDPICTVSLVIVFVYFVFMEAYVGWTAGKRISRMRVLDIAGDRIGLSKSLIRNLLRLVDGLPAFNILGFVLIITSPGGQKLGGPYCQDICR
jgi:uncharacterized RDD family membrane protein YckC